MDTREVNVGQPIAMHRLAYEDLPGDSSTLLQGLQQVVDTPTQLRYVVSDGENLVLVDSQDGTTLRCISGTHADQFVELIDQLHERYQNVDSDLQLSIVEVPVVQRRALWLFDRVSVRSRFFPIDQSPRAPAHDDDFLEDILREARKLTHTAQNENTGAPMRN